MGRDTTGRHLFDAGAVGDTSNAKKRSLILWEVPHLGSNRYIEMYINPQNLQISNNKIITDRLTKGGFIAQYWGEALGVAQIQGTTGDGGIEAINALMDVYRSEQLALLEMMKGLQADFVIPNATPEQQKQGTADFAKQNPALIGIKRRQTLGQLAASVIMWYQGQGHRGYFTDFMYNETAAELGTFTYNLNMKITQVIGKRLNFMPWHRKPWSTTTSPNTGPNGASVTPAPSGAVGAEGGYDTYSRLGRLNTPVLSESLFIERTGKDGKKQILPLDKNTKLAQSDEVKSGVVTNQALPDPKLSLKHGAGVAGVQTVPNSTTQTQTQVENAQTTAASTDQAKKDSATQAQADVAAANKQVDQKGQEVTTAESNKNTNDAADAQITALRKDQSSTQQTITDLKAKEEDAQSVYNAASRAAVAKERLYDLAIKQGSGEREIERLRREWELAKANANNKEQNLNEVRNQISLEVRHLASVNASIDTINKTRQQEIK